MEYSYLREIVFLTVEISNLYTNPREWFWAQKNWEFEITELELPGSDFAYDS